MASFERIYPRRARAAKVMRATVVLRCQLLWNRRVNKCDVIQVTPSGYDFGRAKLNASPDFVIEPPKQHGRVIRRSLIQIQLNF